MCEEPAVDFVKIKLLVHAVDITISMANSCFTGVETKVDTTSLGEDFLEWLYLACKAHEAHFGPSKKPAYQKSIRNQHKLS